MIYEASDDSWTPAEIEAKAAMLRGLINLSIISTVEESTETSCRGVDNNQSLEEADQSSCETEKRSLHEKAFQQWVEARIEFKTQAMMMQLEWYLDYRRWCSENGSIPLSAKEAVTTFKKLYPLHGLSFGAKTFGLQLLDLKDDQEEEEEEEDEDIVQDPPINQWLRSVLQKDVPIVNEPSIKLFQAFSSWFSANISKTAPIMTITQFGLELKQIPGIHSKRSNGTKYSIDTKLLTTYLMYL